MVNRVQHRNEPYTVSSSNMYFISPCPSLYYVRIVAVMYKWGISKFQSFKSFSIQLNSAGCFTVHYLPKVLRYASNSQQGFSRPAV